MTINAVQGNIGGKDMLVVDGREPHRLYGFLFSQYYEWIEGEIAKNGWVEGVDYEVFADNGTPEFLLSFEVAQKLVQPMTDLAAQMEYEIATDPAAARAFEKLQQQLAEMGVRKEPEPPMQRPPTRDVVAEPVAALPEPSPPSVEELPCPEPTEPAVQAVEQCGEPVKAKRTARAAKPASWVISKLSGRKVDPRQCELFEGS
jgi:hypothetical protein